MREPRHSSKHENLGKALSRFRIEHASFLASGNGNRAISPTESLLVLPRATVKIAELSTVCRATARGAWNTAVIEVPQAGPITMKRAVFLDRDGVINRAPAEGDYILRWDDFHFLPGVAEAISSLQGAGWTVIVVSNQRCVAKGLLTIAELEAIHQKMKEELAKAGARLDGIYYCPHEKEPPCDCRKPSPGMFLRAARAHQIDLSVSWMVGDSENDIEAGRRAGCRTVRILADALADRDSDDLAF